MEREKKENEKHDSEEKRHDQRNEYLLMTKIAHAQGNTKKYTY